jgi:acetyl-CoA synthetase
MIDYCGGTEWGGAYVTATVLHPCAAGSFNTWALGMDVEIRDDAGLPANVGEAYLVPPSIGLSTQLLNADHDEAYHNGVPRPGLRRHGDRIAALERGYYRVLGRSDDTMNLGGIKVGSAEIEGALADIPEVRELAAVGLPTPGGGPDCLVVVAAHTSKERVDPEALKRIMQGEINRRLNPLFKVAEVIIVEALPRTASNKVMRREIRNRLVDASPGL